MKVSNMERPWIAGAATLLAITFMTATAHDAHAFGRPNPRPTPKPSIGHIDAVDGQGWVTGWAIDRANESAPAQVHFFLDGDNSTGRSLDIVTADQHRADVGNHGFGYQLPGDVMDGNSHTLYAYRLPAPGSATPPELISNSGIRFTTSAITYDFGMEVFDASVGGRRVSGARIDIGGDQRSTDGNGFAHYGLRGGVYTVRIEANGYETFEAQYRVDRHHVEGFPSGNNPTYRVALKRAPVSGGIVGQLRIDPNGGFVDDLGPVLPIFAHFGDALSRWSRGQQNEVMADLDRIKAAGFDGIRFWSTLGGNGTGGGYWAGRAVSPTATREYWAHVEAFLTAVRDRGLVVQLSQGDVYRDAIPDRQAFAHQMAAVVNRVGTQVVALFEGANESRDTGEPDAGRLATFVQHFKDRCPAPLMSLSAYTGHEDVAVIDDFSRAPADLFVVHSYRGGRWWDKIRHVFSLVYEGKPKKRIGWNGEGPGFGALVSAIDNKHELDDDWYTLMAAQALITRQGYVWFSGPGVISDHHNGERLENMPGFHTVARVKTMLPADVMFYNAGLSHGGTTWANRRVFAAVGETRADQVTHSDGRFCTVIYGEHPEQVQAVRSYTATHDTWIGRKGRIVCGRM